jgi:hypothetical protein
MVTKARSSCLFLVRTRMEENRVAGLPPRSGRCEDRTSQASAAPISSLRALSLAPTAGSSEIGDCFSWTSELWVPAFKIVKCGLVCPVHAGPRQHSGRLWKRSSLLSRFHGLLNESCFICGRYLLNGTRCVGKLVLAEPQ